VIERIALTGLARSGKSTAAEYLALRGYRRTRFAAPLKYMLVALYQTAGLRPGEIERRIEGDLKEVPDPVLLGQTPRYAMQTLGTEWRDLIDRDLWTQLWLRQVAGRGLMTVEDCRFEHEFNVAKRVGFVVVEIRRDGAGTTSTHASENGTGHEPDFVIDNNGSLQDLHWALENIRCRN